MMYLVAYGTGESCDWQQVSLFVTSDPQKARNYCIKFNRILKALKEHYNIDSDWWKKTSGTELLFNRKYRIMDANRADWNQIEVR